MKKLISIVTAALAVLAVFFCAPMHISAGPTDTIVGTPAGANSSLLSINQYKKGMMASIFNNEADKTTWLIGGKQWKITYRGKDNTDITEVEYVYNDQGVLQYVENLPTNTRTYYDNGKPNRDTLRYEDATGAMRETITGKYVHEGGVMTSKVTYGYVGNAGVTNPGAAVDVTDDGVSNADSNYAITQTMTFRNGRQDEVITHWAQNSEKEWTYNEHGGIVSQKYVWDGDQVAAILTGDNIIGNTSGGFQNVTTVSVYKAGKDHCTYSLDNGMTLNFDTSRNAYIGTTSNLLDGTDSHARITLGTGDAEKVAVRTSQTIYDGVKKLYSIEYSADATTNVLRYGISTTDPDGTILNFANYCTVNVPGYTTAQNTFNTMASLVTTADVQAKYGASAKVVDGKLVIGSNVYGFTNHCTVTTADKGRKTFSGKCAAELTSDDLIAQGLITGATDTSAKLEVSADVSARGKKIVSKAVYDTHGRAAYSINFKDDQTRRIGKVWKYNDTSDEHNRKFTFNVASIQVKQKQNADGSSIDGKSIITIAGQSLELNCNPEAAATIIAALSGALAATEDQVAAAITAFNTANGGLSAAGNASAIREIRAMFDKIGGVSFKETTAPVADDPATADIDETSAGLYEITINNVEDQMSYKSGSLQYVLDFSNVKSNQTIEAGAGQARKTGATIVTVTITYNDENGQQKAQFQTLGELSADGTFTTNVEQKSNGTYAYADSSIEVFAQNADGTTAEGDWGESSEDDVVRED